MLPLDTYIPEPNSGCWLWLGSTNAKGYGLGYIQGKQVLAHRLSASIYKSFDIKSSLLVLHKCDNRCCVNPEHLFIGTAYDNTQDMLSKNRQRNQFSGKLFCQRGHEFDALNTKFTAAGNRSCRACVALKARERRSKKSPS